MGYTHYWYTKPVLTKPKFEKFAADCRKLFDYCTGELGIDLANGAGDPDTSPEVTKDIVVFNGSEAQRIGHWTTDEQVEIPWPSETAGLTPEISDPIGKKTAGHWFAGTVLQQRTAPLSDETGKGSGAYETVVIERDRTKEEYKQPNENGVLLQPVLLFACCKTAYRPYDLVVTAVLIAAKHHFGEDIELNSDGESKDWQDGRVLCNNVLGYGLAFDIEAGKVVS